MTKEKQGLNSKLDKVVKFVDKIEEQVTVPKKSFWDTILGKSGLKKEFKLPKRVKVGFKNKIKQNYALIFYLMTNGHIKLYFEPIQNDLIYIREKQQYHAANSKYILRYEKYPVIIQPEWSLLPFSPAEHYKDIEKKAGAAVHQKVIIQAVKMAGINPPRKIQGKTLLWILVAAIVALYLLSQVLTGGTT